LIGRGDEPGHVAAGSSARITAPMTAIAAAPAAKQARAAAASSTPPSAMIGIRLRAAADESASSPRAEPYPGLLALRKMGLRVTASAPAVAAASISSTLCIEMLIQACLPRSPRAARRSPFEPRWTPKSPAAAASRGSPCSMSRAPPAAASGATSRQSAI
jgi:hypothetical protein